ncbi:hypothetical protein [Saccharopolyspora sp. NPDC002376]
MSPRSLLSWNVLVPVLAIITLAISLPQKGLGLGMILVIAVLLTGAVLAAAAGTSVRQARRRGTGAQPRAGAAARVDQ